MRLSTRPDEAVSVVVAVLLMVSVAIVLSLTAYLWVNDLASTPADSQNASFRVRAVDLPLVPGAPPPDADDGADALEITYLAGSRDLGHAEVSIAIDGQVLAARTSGAQGFADASTTYCASLPGSTTMANGFTWARGASIYLWRADGTSCADAGAAPGLQGRHLVKVTAFDQSVLDTVVDVAESLA